MPETITNLNKAGRIKQIKGGNFQKGKSGNPSGKKTGLKSAMKKIWQDLLDPNLTEKVIAMIKQRIEADDKDFIKMYCALVIAKSEPKLEIDIKLAGKSVKEQIETINKALEINDISLTIAERLTALVKIQNEALINKGNEVEQINYVEQLTTDQLVRIKAITGEGRKIEEAIEKQEAKEAKTIQVIDRTLKVKK